MKYRTVRHADLIATFSDQQEEIHDGAILIADNQIVAVGPDAEIAARISAEAIPIGFEIDARGHVVIPGLVNTHHHFYQTLTRAVPAGQDAALFDWLVTHYPIWARMDQAALIASSQIAATELILSGCTTASDHTYLWPNDCTPDDQIAAVTETGLRFHCSRGSMSVGESGGGLPPDSVVEREDAILADTQRVIEAYHQADRFAMTRIVVAPCSPFSVSPDLMRESAALARSYGVHLHTHLAETRDEEAYCLETLGATPVAFAESVGWTGEDVWFAHMVHPHTDEIAKLGACHCGAAHCPSSNMRLASGIAPVMAMHAAGMRVGFGVDGSASNDSSHLLGEARQALLLQRLATALETSPAAVMTARQALWFATRGGASVLGRDDIGQLSPGYAADIVGFRLDTLSMAGASPHDPLAALVFTQPSHVSFSIINGRPRVRDGEMLGMDIPNLITRHNEAAIRMVRGD